MPRAVIYPLRSQWDHTAGRLIGRPSIRGLAASYLIGRSLLCLLEALHHSVVFGPQLSQEKDKENAYQR